MGYQIPYPRLQFMYMTHVKYYSITLLLSLHVTILRNEMSIDA